MKIYYGYNINENKTIYATVTGEMCDGSLVYTECETTEDGVVLFENEMPKLLLDKQYKRHLKKGFQTFERI